MTQDIREKISASCGVPLEAVISSPDASFSTTQYELFFQERSGSRFNTRVHIDCPNDVYKRLFESQQPLTIELTMEDGKHYAFTYKPKKWQESRPTSAKCWR